MLYSTLVETEVEVELGKLFKGDESLCVEARGAH